MSRAGRKRKIVSKREPNGRAQRDGSRDRGTPEFQGHRLRLVGPEHMHDARAGDPLGVLELAGIVTASQRHAGLRWGRAMWATYGKPHAPAVSLEAMPKGTSQGPSPHAERTAKAGIDALSAAGHDAYHWTREVCVEGRLPGWYRRAHKRPADDKRAQALADGLRVLERVMPAERLD